MSLCLGIDTTGSGGAVALANSDGALGREVHDPEQGYAEEIFGLIDRLLTTTGVSKSQVERISVVHGPGSFTGLRIGVMSAKAIAFAREIPLWSAGTLQLLAACEGAERRFVLSEAGGGHFWAGVYEDEGRVIVRETERVAASALPALVEAAGWPRIIAHGREVGAKVESAFSESRPEIGIVDDLATRIAILAAREKHPAQLVDTESLMPDYVSPSQAERAHGLDLRDELARPIEPTGWS